MHGVSTAATTHALPSLPSVNSLHSTMTLWLEGKLQYGVLSRVWPCRLCSHRPAATDPQPQTRSHRPAATELLSIRFSSIQPRGETSHRSEHLLICFCVCGCHMLSRGAPAASPTPSSCSEHWPCLRCGPRMEATPCGRPRVHHPFSQLPSPWPGVCCVSGRG